MYVYQLPRLATTCYVGYNSTTEKQKLQNVMAFGSELEPVASTVVKPHPLSDKDETEVDRFEEVMKEIEERKEFLEEMEALGQGDKYRSKLMTEISQVYKDNIIVMHSDAGQVAQHCQQVHNQILLFMQKIYELERMDKERTAEFTY